MYTDKELEYLAKETTEDIEMMLQVEADFNMSGRHLRSINRRIANLLRIIDDNAEMMLAGKTAIRRNSLAKGQQHAESSITTKFTT